MQICQNRVVKIKFRSLLNYRVFHININYLHNEKSVMEISSIWHTKIPWRQYSRYLRPTAKQLWKPPVGVLELEILNADALTPMKMRNGPRTITLGTLSSMSSTFGRFPIHHSSNCCRFQQRPLWWCQWQQRPEDREGSEISTVQSSPSGWRRWENCICSHRCSTWWSYTRGCSCRKCTMWGRYRWCSSMCCATRPSTYWRRV